MSSIRPLNNRHCKKVLHQELKKTILTNPQFTEYLKRQNDIEVARMEWDKGNEEPIYRLPSPNNFIKSLNFNPNLLKSNNNLDNELDEAKFPELNVEERKRRLRKCPLRDLPLSDFIDLGKDYNYDEEKEGRETSEQLNKDYQKRIKNIEKEDKKKENYKSKGYWRRYNKAQYHEYGDFDYYVDSLLDSLKEVIIRDNYEEGGRPKLDDSDIIKAFLCVSHYGKSVRRSEYLLSRLYREGHTSRWVHGTSVWKYMKRPEFTEVLRVLIEMSAFPMLLAENIIAVDSSGFRTTRYSEYYLDKHVRKIDQFSEKKKKGKEKEKSEAELNQEKKRVNEWEKLHIAIGTQSHAIANAYVTGSRGEGTGDPSVLPRLLPEIVELLGGRDVGTDYVKSIDGKKMFVAGDTIYGSIKNYNLSKRYGIQLITPYAKNCNPDKRRYCMSWYRMWKMSEEEPYKWAKIYHQRSNVESVFSSIKQTIGETLRCRHDVSKVNEIYCKVIVHNIRMLILYNSLNDLNLNFDNSEDALEYYQTKAEDVVYKRAERELREQMKEQKKMRAKTTSL